MVRRQIVLDDETDRMLASLAQQHSGNVNAAISDLLHHHQTVETILDEHESLVQDSLTRQKLRSEAGFREGRSSSWTDVKQQNNL